MIHLFQITLSILGVLCYGSFVGLVAVGALVEIFFESRDLWRRRRP